MLTLFFLMELLCLRYLECIVVMTNSGPVRGRVVEGYGARYLSFTGIPYAESPAGDRRFKPPVPKKPWDTVFDATLPGPVCPQDEFRHKRSEMSEDCLVLNVYAPVNKTGVAVLGFVHGGGINVLSGNTEPMYGPDLFMQRGVIMVTMNYRLGALGFLSLGNKRASGNAGLKDILLSFKWIKQNIAKFGGDPDNVTIGGHSSGAYLAHWLMLTQQASGLFQKAILISGSAVSYRFFAKYSKARALVLGEYLNLPTNSTDALLDKLTKIDVYEIIRGQNALPKLSPKYYLPLSPFTVCIENDYDDAIVTRHPIEIIKSGIPQNVPVLAGFNTEEGLNLMLTLEEKHVTTNILQNKLDLTIPRDIEYPHKSQERENLINSIHDLYFGRKDRVYNVIEFLSDSQYNHDINYWIKIHKEKEMSNKVYYYLLGLDCDVNYAKLIYNFSFPGMSHGDDLGFLFVSDITRELHKNLSDKCNGMINTLLTYFVNFINYSDPTPAFVNMTPKWEDCGQERKHMFISEQSKFRPYAPFSKRMQFWSDVYDNFYRYVKRGGPLEIFVL